MSALVLSWFVYTLFVSTVFGLLALAWEQLCRITGWRMRWAWIAAITGSLGLPLLLAASPPDFAPATLLPANAIDTALTAALPAPVPDSLPAAASAGEFQPVTTRLNLDAWLLAAWATASVALLAMLARGWRSLRRRSAAWTAAHVDNTDVLIAEDTGPAVFGFAKPAIVLPRWLLSAEDTVQRIALLHEREHLRAGDSRLLATTLFCIALLPWNLPLWWQLRRLRQALEIDCDARVLNHGHMIRTYGDVLLQVAAARSSIPRFAAALTEAPDSLERRIRLLGTTVRRLPRPLSLALMCALLGIGTFAVAQVAPSSPGQVPRHVVRGSDADGTARDRNSNGEPAAAMGAALLVAAGRGDVARIERLLASGVDPDFGQEGDGTALIIASRHGHREIAERLLTQGADVNRSFDGDGNPLIAAAAARQGEMVEFLVARGADLNAVVVDDETPLINAARAGDLGIVRYLVERGAQVDLAVEANSWGRREMRSPLSEARKHGHVPVSEYLQSMGAGS